MENKEFICINCPRGCHLKVMLRDDKQVTSVEGNQCKRGEEYARSEAVEPLRVLTGLMRVEGQTAPLSVKTSKPIPKKMLFQCVNEIRSHEAVPPIATGDIIIGNVCKTGADVVATANYSV